MNTSEQCIVHDPNDVPTSAFRRLFRHWLTLKNRLGRPPAWSDFSIESVTDLLPDITLLSHDEKEGTLIIQRLGVTACRLIGKSREKTRLDQLPFGETMMKRSVEISESAQAYYFERHKLQTQNGDICFVGLFVIPLQSDCAKAPDHYMIALHERDHMRLHNSLQKEERAQATLA